MGSSGSLKISPFDRAHYDFLLTFHSNHGLSRTISEIDGDFSRKSQNFPTPCILRPSLKGSLWNWVSALGDKKTRMMGLPGRERRLTISSAVWTQYTNVMDRRTDTGPQQRPRLCIVSRGKRELYCPSIKRKGLERAAEIRGKVYAHVLLNTINAHLHHRRRTEQSDFTPQRSIIDRIADKPAPRV